MYLKHVAVTDRKVRFALVGCGRISVNHLEAMKQHADRAELVAVCDNDAEALAAAIARLVGDASLYEQIGEKAAQHVRDHFTFEGFIDRLEQTYLTIVAHHRQGKPVVLTE